METIELEKGWLIREMEEVQQKSGNWPDVMRPLMTLNDPLIHPSIPHRIDIRRRTPSN